MSMADRPPIKVFLMFGFLAGQVLMFCSSSFDPSIE
jgi:hypothetical protein